MSNAVASMEGWENKVMTGCPQCRQRLRLPISYKPLHVACPKCRTEFFYNYIAEFGNQGEYRAELQAGTVVSILIWIVAFLGSLALSIAIRSAVGVILILLAGAIILPQLVDYRVFAKYRTVELLLLNQQGMIYFDRAFRAQECLNWSDIRSVKCIYIKRMFLGLIEANRKPACIELDMGEKGKALIPPALFFSEAARTSIIDAILRHYGQSSYFGIG